MEIDHKIEIGSKIMLEELFTNSFYSGKIIDIGELDFTVEWEDGFVFPLPISFSDLKLVKNYLTLPNTGRKLFIIK